MSYTQMATQSVPPRRRAMLSDSMVHQSVIDQIITQHVVTGAATDDGFSPDSAAVEQRFQAAKQRFTDEDGNVNEAAFDEALAAENLTRERLREMITNQLILQQQREKMMQEAGPPSADSIEAVSERNRRFQAQHILIQVSDTADQAKVDSARQAAAALIDSVEAGMSFDMLAKRYSEGPSAERGGRLPPTTRQRLAAPFADAALALEDSTQVTQEPVRTRFGFHVIRLLDRGEPADTARVRQALAQQKQRQAYQDKVEELRGSSDLTVRINPSIVKVNLDG
jgi:peptidyl-prolyl cis-trans isomerase C